MSKRSILIFITAALILGLLGAVGYSSMQHASAQCTYQARPLTEATAQEIGAAAIQYTCAQFNAPGETTVRLARRTKDSDFVALGSAPEDVCQENPLYLVVVQTNFTRKIGSRGQELNYKYVAYIFDLTTGYPIAYAASPNGGAFRQLLDDTSLADDPVLVPPELLTPDARMEQMLAKTREAESRQPKASPCGSGSPAPTIMPPSQ